MVVSWLASSIPESTAASIFSIKIPLQNGTQKHVSSQFTFLFFILLRKKTVLLCLCNWYKVLFQEANDTWIPEHSHILQIKVRALHPPHSSSNQIALLHMDSRQPSQSSTGIKKGVTSSARLVSNWERITYFWSNAIWTASKLAATVGQTAFQIAPFSHRNAVRATTIRKSDARTTCKVGTLGFGHWVWTTSVRAEMATTALMIWTLSWRLTIRTTPVGCLLAWATFAIRPQSSLKVIGAASKFRVSATT